MTADSNDTSFKPYIPASAELTELSFSAVLLGSVLGVIFGASSLYLFLKVGMTVSASIPVAVLAITIFRGLSRAFGTRPTTILENNIVQTAGSAGESIAFGVGAAMPALMLLGYELEWTRVMLVAVLGGLLGILMMIPLRRAFIVKQHGTLPYPEGTACAKVLIVGEHGGSNARTVFLGFGVGFVYQILMKGLKLWSSEWDKAITGIKGYTKAVVSLEPAPALLGVGYIVGPRIASVMVGGGILTALLLTPMIAYFGEGLPGVLPPGQQKISAMSAGQISSQYVRYIGAGAVAAGGILSMLNALPLIFGSIRDSFSAFGGARNAALTDRNVVRARLAAYPAQFSESMTRCPGREVLAGPAWPEAATIGPPGETVTVRAVAVRAVMVRAVVAGLRVPSPVNALTVSTRDAAATAAPARWSFRIYRPFLCGEPRHYAGAGQERTQTPP